MLSNIVFKFKIFIMNNLIKIIFDDIFELFDKLVNNSFLRFFVFWLFILINKL